MRIAQVAPLYESVPPARYGGTERVVAYLTEQLVRRGHEVTLFASGDSSTAAELIPVVERALWLGAGEPYELAPHVLMLEQVAQQADRFDVIHFHLDLLHLPLASRLDTPYVSTLHGRLDLPGLDSLFRLFSDAPLVAISDAQREPLPWANWRGTVYHGLPLDQYAARTEPGGYLAFLGRIAPEKGVERAIEIAHRLELPLKVAAKFVPAFQEYFERVIGPLDDDPLVDYVGELVEGEKGAFLAGARALLFPIEWPEPFGLVMIEAMACGTPVVGFRTGSVPEVIDDGITGFVVDDVDGAVAAVERLHTLSRRRCRETFERRFSDARMARDYELIYERLVAASPLRAEAARSA